MPRTPMTPERFQSRDVKRRLSALEKKREYMVAEIHRLVARIRVLEGLVDHLAAHHKETFHTGGPPTSES